MVAIDLDLHLHNAIRLFMREEGKSADQAFDTALRLLFTALAEEGDHSLELEIHRQALIDFADWYNHHWLLARHGDQTPHQVRARQRQADLPMAA